ncbi:MAG: HAD-IA family hydrolase [Phycisphaerales bacterium]
MPTPTPDIALVCFDWGGVILRICRDWREACAAAGIEVRPGSEGGESAPRRREVVQAHQEGRIAFEDYTRALADAFDNLYTADEIARVHDAWLLHEYDGVADLVAQLHDAPAARGVRTALLSNTNERHLTRGLAPALGGLGHFPTAHTLHHCFYSNRVGHSKPGRAFYEALTKHAEVEPRRTLFFDDLAENIQTARGLGWNAVHIDPHADTAAQIRAALREHGVMGT